jgi:hypothetical protein
MNKLLIISLLLLVGLNGFGQDTSFCLEFSKDKKHHKVKESKSINYVLAKDTIWKKGNLSRIVNNSISIEHYKESTLFAEEENTFILTYHLDEIKAIAYKKPETVIKGATIVTASTIVIIASLGALAEGINPENSFKRFNKIVDTESEWKFNIVNCNN